MLCDKEIPTKFKVLLYKTAIKPTLMDTINYTYIIDKLTALHITMVNKFHCLEDMRSGLFDLVR